MNDVTKLLGALWFSGMVATLIILWGESVWLWLAWAVALCAGLANAVLMWAAKDLRDDPEPGAAAGSAIAMVWSLVLLPVAAIPPIGLLIYQLGGIQ